MEIAGILAAGVSVEPVSGISNEDLWVIPLYKGGDGLHLCIRAFELEIDLPGLDISKYLKPITPFHETEVDCHFIVFKCTATAKLAKAVLASFVIV